MSQCVPNWEVDEPPVARTSSEAVPYEMAELTWENGHLSMHGLGLRRPPKSSYPPLAGTLESIVAPCFGPLVPTTDVGSCAAPGDEEEEEGPANKKARAAEASVSVSRLSSSTFGTDSWHVPTTTVDTCPPSLGSMSSSGLPATTLKDDHDSVCHSRPPQSETGEEEQEQEQETKRNVKSSSSTRRSRAAAIHNQSERKRRDKINQKMKTLQKLVPNSNKADKASMLDEVIEYLKQLQAQVQMMSRMSMTPAAAMNMMMPQLAMQQQLQMSMMAAAAASASPMGMGMGMGPMGMGMAAMDMNPMARHQNHMASSFMPLAAGWDGTAPGLDRQAAAAVVPTDPISSYLACQSQPMPIEAYSRMIALIQQQQQQLASLSKH